MLELTAEEVKKFFKLDDSQVDELDLAPAGLLNLDAPRGAVAVGVQKKILTNVKDVVTLLNSALLKLSSMEKDSVKIATVLEGLRKVMADIKAWVDSRSGAAVATGRPSVTIPAVVSPAASSAPEDSAVIPVSVVSVD